MTDIVLDRVCKSFGGPAVLKDLSLVFKAGTVTCVTGPSGCGKTTLLNIIAGLLPPDSGSVAGVPEKLSFVFQEDRLCEDFSALRNIRLVCGKALSPEEIGRHLARLGLEDAGKKPVREFSGGMRRRVAIARAICYGGDLVLLDEPFKGLDEELKTSVMDYVLENTGGKTLICVTHDRAEAEYLGGEHIALGGSAGED